MEYFSHVWDSCDTDVLGLVTVERHGEDKT